MKLYFKQRFFSWFDSYDIYGEDGQTLYTFEGKLAWGHKLHILNPTGAHIATVKEVVLTFLPRFELYLGEQYIGCIQKKFTLFRPQYQIDCNGWDVQGNWMEWDHRPGRSARRLGQQGAAPPDRYLRHRGQRPARRAVRTDAHAGDRRGKVLQKLKKGCKARRFAAFFTDLRCYAGPSNRPARSRMTSRRSASSPSSRTVSSPSPPLPRSRPRRSSFSTVGR